MRHSHQVDVRDVKEASRLQEVATQRTAVDPRTGQLDISLIMSGMTDTDRETLEENVKLIIDVLSKETNKVLKCSELLLKINQSRTKKKPLESRDLEKCIIQLELEEKICCDKQSSDPIV